MATSRTSLLAAAVLCAAGFAVILFLTGSGGGTGDARDGAASVPASVEERAQPDPPLTVPSTTDVPEVREIATDRRFACDPRPAASPSGEDLAARLDRLRRESEARAQTLERADDVDLRLAGALLSVSDRAHPDYIQRLLSALALDPDHPLILERLLDACINDAESGVCARQDIAERAAQADGDNGEMWAAIAGYRASRGDVKGALAALRRAASAGTHRGYFVEFIRVMELGLAAAAGHLSYAERIGEALGRAAGFTVPYSPVVDECRARAGEDPLWHDVCLDFARHLERNGQTVMNRMMGIGMQILIAEETADGESLASASEREQESLAWLEEHSSADTQVVLANDERVLREYLQEFDAHGEPAALVYLRTEVERLKQIPGYDPCLPEASATTE